MKAETTRPAAKKLLGQQERFDEWIEEFNFVRPHEALGQRPPASLYSKSERSFHSSEPQYPLHDRVCRVSACGKVIVSGVGKVFLTQALGGELVGLRELCDGRWLVTFGSLDLGLADFESGRFEPSGSTEKVSPMSSD